MAAFTVTVKVNENFTEREVEARNAVSACKKAAKHGGFSQRDISSAYIEEDHRMTFLSIRPGVSYSVFR